MIPFTLKKILLTEFSIGKWIHSNHLSDNPPKDNVPFNVYWECAPIFYQSFSILGKFQVWFYSIIIPFIIYKLLEPAIFHFVTYLKPIFLSNIKMIAMITGYSLMLTILIVAMIKFSKGLQHGRNHS